MGKLYFLRGLLQDSLEFYKQSLPLIDAEDSTTRGVALHSLGLVYDELGDRREALNNYFAALPLRKQAGKREYADTLTNVAIIFRNLGQPYKALEYYNQLLPIYTEVKDETGDAGGLIDLYINIGNVDLDLQKYDEAISNYEKAIALHPTKRSEAIARDNIALASKELGRQDDALNFHRQAFRLYGEAEDEIGQETTLLNLGALYEEMDNLEASFGAYREALINSERTENLDDEGIAYYGLARISQKLGQPDRSLKYYEQSISILEKLRNSIPLNEALAGFTATKNPVYYGMISLLTSQNQEVEAFNLLEQFRARSARETLAQADVNMEDILPVELSKKKQDVVQRLSDINRTLNKAELFAGKQQTPMKGREELIAERNKLSLENDELEVEIGRYNLPSGALYDSLKAEALQRQLSDNTAFLEYIFGEDIDPVLLAVVTNKACHFYSLPVNGKQLNILAAKYVDALWRSEGDDFSHSGVGERLYQMLLAPAAADLGHVERLVISPDSALQRLPFEALVEEDGGVNKFLLEKYEIFYAPSATVLSRLGAKMSNDADSQRADLIAFAIPSYTNPSQPKADSDTNIGLAMRSGLESGGVNLDPIPYSEEEVKNAAYYASRRAQLHVGPSVTEQEVKKAPLKDYRIVHFALHAVADDNPANCSLIFNFNESEPDDGLLSIKEIMGLRFNADMVVLSACETGRGLEMRGEGVQSLAQAALLSGARSVVASQWEVNDKATAEFMGRFYKRLAEGESKAGALRKAKLDLLHSNSFSHPRYWAAFVLIGDGDGKIGITPKSWWYWYVGIFLLLALAATGLLYIKTRRTRAPYKSRG